MINALAYTFRNAGRYAESLDVIEEFEARNLKN